MSVQEDQVKPVSAEVTSGSTQEQGDNKLPVEASKVLLETAIVDDVDEQVEQATNNTEPAKSTVSRMNDVPVEFVSNYNTISTDHTTLGVDKTDQPNLGKLSESKVQETLTCLYSDACTIWSYASEYDYSPEAPYNGFRTFLKVLFSYFDRISLSVRLIKLDETPDKEREKLINQINDYIDFLPLLVYQMDAVKLIRKQINSESSKNDTGDSATDQVQDASLPIELMIVHNEMNLTPKDMTIFYKKNIFAFWLPMSIRKLILKIRKGSVCLSYPWTQGLAALFSEKKRSKLLADYSIYWSYIDTKQLVDWMPTPKLTRDATATKFNLEKRQDNWIIVKDASSVLAKESVANEMCLCHTSPVRLVIIKPKLKQTDRVILQIHGGGWTVGSVEMSYTWMNPWVKEIGATIVAIDYSLAPTHKYPIGLQEILDTYLWLSDASKSGTVLEPLGFVPQDIVVTGDSAGGNLTMALAVCLAEITKKSTDPPKLPRALVPMYPAASPGMPFITPSSAQFDALLAPLQRTKMGIYYYLSEEPADPKVSYLSGKNNPWFSNQAKYKDLYTQVNGHKGGDPLFHLVTYKSYDLLKQVPLYIQAAEFDVFLDDAVDLAKLWKGEVIFDVMPNAIHGYLMFDELSPECRRASEKSLARLKQAIGK